MGSEVIIPVQEIALQCEEVPLEFLVGEEVQKTLLNSEDPDQVGGLMQLPVIDLKPLINADEGDAEAVREEIGKACEAWGFFQVINHGIPEHLLERTLRVVQEFFDLPLEEKQVYAMKRGETQGYGRVMKPKIRPWSDAFRHAARPQPTPDQDARPRTPETYRDVMDGYTEEIVRLARILTVALSEYLGLEAEALQDLFSERAYDYPMVTITINLYPRCPQPGRVLGIYPHSDAGILTVLYQGEGVAGLQVFKEPEGKWITVEPLKNALVINVANQLEVLSNGRLKSSKHRAVVNDSKPRISIAAFCGPGSPDVVIGPLPQLVGENQSPLYPTMPYSSYSSAYFNRDMEANPLSLLDSMDVRNG